MNAAQQALYFREWGKVRAHYIARGIDPKQADHKRHELHVQALGCDKSSKSFTNADLDKVLAKFRAVYDGGNLDAQLAAIDMPEKRRTAMERRIFSAGAKFISGDDHHQREWRTIAYTQGICRKLGFPADWPMRDERQLAQVMGIIERRAQQGARKAAEEAKAAVANYDEDENPF